MKRIRIKIYNPWDFSRGFIFFLFDLCQKPCFRQYCNK
nr:MAG TPA: hypothetical protein [Caudoviricetes sp.]